MNVEKWSISDRQVLPQQLHFIPRCNDALSFKCAKSKDWFGVGICNVTLSLNHDYRNR